MSTRAAILAALRQSLAAAQHLPPALPRTTLPLPPPATFAECQARFVTELQNINGTPLTAPAAEVPALVLSLLHAREARGLLSWAQTHLPVPGLLAALQTAGLVVDDGMWTAENRPARLAAMEKITVGLTGVEAALADTGTLALRGGPGRPRLASLSVRTHIALYTPAQLHVSWAAWWASLPDPAATVAASSSLTLISGPSRTADIEMTLTVGVHGPKEVIAVCVT